jgi:hypothetical protein
VDEPFRTFLQSVGWHEGAFEAYRKAEEYQLKLLKLRQREQRAKKNPKADFDSVDALFDDGQKPPSPVRFVGESGTYEAGKIAAKEKAKLPKDAIEIVQQLLIWLPEDDRLYWLLGELYNARGGAKDIQAARLIFDELAGARSTTAGSWTRRVVAPELAEHYRVLRDYRDPDAATPFDINKKIDEEEQKRRDAAPGFDWQNLAVGFGAGLVVAIFGSWQLREIRRRRQNRA